MSGNRKSAYSSEITGFQQRLRQLIESRGLIQGAVAAQLGTQQAVVSLWLSGRIQIPSGIYLIKLARFFKVDPEWLLTGTISDRKPLEHVEMLHAH